MWSIDTLNVLNDDLNNLKMNLKNYLNQYIFFIAEMKSRVEY